MLRSRMLWFASLVLVASVSAAQTPAPAATPTPSSTPTATSSATAAQTPSTTAAETPSPMVTMNVTLPDGKSQELTAHESRVATVKLADGTEYGFRPTILDSSPWNRIVITIFKMPTSTESTKVVGETEVKRGAAAVASKTTPAFKLAVPNVTAPTHGGTAQTS